jgi:hypothetical protein
MARMPETGRQAAHAFLDALSGGTFVAEGVEAAAIDLAVERLNEVGAVEATLEGDDNLRLDISNLVGGVLTAMTFLVRQLALYAEVDEQEVIIRTREFIDGE